MHVNPTRGFRPELQGLRAVAVLMVVLFHAGVPGLQGGFVGVDVFFVISGYLISRLLMDDLARFGRIRYANFFARRAKRLLPAALVLVVMVSLVSYAIYPPSEQRVWLSTVRSAALYFSNVWLAGRSLDYFSSDTHANPLLHTWSLSVEEQFYLVWPWLLAVAWWWTGRGDHGLRHRRMMWLIVVFIVGGALLCVAVTRVAQPWAFYGMPLRAWEFALGALVLLLPTHALAPRQLLVLQFAGAALLAAAAGGFDERLAFPGAWALVPAVGTALLLAGLQSDAVRGPMHRVLASRPAVAIGDISYSLYLWHWPFLVWVAALWPAPSPLARSLAVVCALSTATLSYRWIESPVRRWTIGRLENLLPISLSLASSVAVAAATTFAIARVGQPPEPGLARIEAAVHDRTVLYANGCHQYFFDVDPKPCTYGPAGAVRTLVLVGDSHAAQWFPALERWAQTRGVRLISMTKAACPMLDLEVRNVTLRRDYVECTAWKQAALRALAAWRPEVVLLSNASYYELADGQRAVGLQRMVRLLAVDGTRVVVLRDSPRPGFNPVTCHARSHWQRRGDAHVCTFPRADDQAWRPALAAREAQVLKGLAPLARYVDTAPWFCEGDLCSTLLNGQPRFSDEHHLAASFVSTLLPQLAAVLDQAMP